MNQITNIKVDKRRSVMVFNYPGQKEQFEQNIPAFLLSVMRGLIVDSKKVKMIANTCKEEISKLCNWSDFNISLLREQNCLDTFSPEIRHIFYSCCDMLVYYMPDTDKKRTTATDTQGNLFFDHQEMIPPKQTTKNQLSLF